MRNPRQREADLRAQLAAGRAGAERVAALVERYGLDTLRAGLRRDARLRRAPHPRPDRRARGRRRARRRDVLEAADGDLELRAARDRARATSSSSTSSGSAAQHDGNLNCPLAVTLSACYFALRVLTDPDVPALRGRLPAAHGARARGLAPERAPAGRGGRRQRGDLLARGRPGAGRVRPGAAGRAR